MANKNFKDYAIAGSNVTLTYDDINDTVTFAAQGNVQSVNAKTGVVVINKTDVGLSAVDNTTDLLKPISTATQTALDGKVDENAVITAATKTKITYDAKGLVTIGADATTADIADSTDKRYVTDAQATVIGNTSGTNTGDNATNSQYSGLAASKQDTLVSGTNLKTINSTSLLGSGDISIAPSGVAGAIQFSNGSAFSSDATNLFWDNTNKRLGIGTNSPESALSLAQIIALTTGSTTPRISNIAYTINNSGVQTGTLTGIFLNATETLLNGQTHNLMDLQVGGVSRFKVDRTGTLTIPNISLSSNGGINCFSVTIATAGGFASNGFGGMYFSSNGVFRLQNQAGTDFSRLQLGGTTSSFPSIKRALNNIEIKNADDTFGAGFSVGGALVTSSILQADSTTKGFLPPRMTTTQRDAITSPATGLKVYNTTTNTTDTFDGTSWQRFGQQTFIKGSGATSATTSLLVQNSSGTQLLSVRDDGYTVIGAGVQGILTNSITVQNWGNFGSGVSELPSAVLQANSTTRGFLPPRMTTTQKNAISSPASGLVVYDTTLNKLCVRTASAWETITSV